MTDRQETIADIIAEMKREAAQIFPALPIAVLQLANRLEAAWKRERGDAAKLREALRECAQYMKTIAALAATEKEGGAK